MTNLENRIERDKLIDDYFNKGYACDIREVYQAVVNTIADLEYANDEKVDEIKRLNNIINELENYFNKIKDTSTLEERMIAKYMLKYIKQLKGSESNDKQK